jgi:rhamnosyltransferase
MNYLTRTCGLVISYNPDKQLVQNIKNLVKQVDKVIVVDNGSFDVNSIKCLNAIENLRNPNVQIVLNEKNLGIATALNQGISLSIEKNYEWLLTFDQDTLVPDRFIDSLFDCYDNIESKQDIAMLCPLRVDSIPYQKSLFDSNSYRYISSTMTSGSLMKISVIKDIGMFDESLFIDWVDHDYCMRAKIAKYKIVQSINTPLFHVAGNITQHVLFSKKIPTSNHSALRRYYMSRNRTICYKRYLLVDTNFVIDDCLLALREVAKIILLEDDKLNKLSMMCVGIKDAIFEKKGEYVSHTK